MWLDYPQFNYTNLTCNASCLIARGTFAGMTLPSCTKFSDYKVEVQLFTRIILWPGSIFSTETTPKY